MIGLDKNQVAHLKPFDIRLETRLGGGGRGGKAEM